MPTDSAPAHTYCYQPHKGIAAARNNGIVHATGEIVAIVADDYILDPSYAATVTEFFRLRSGSDGDAIRVTAAQRNLGSQISHFYFDTSVRRRLSGTADAAPRGWKERLARSWQTAPRQEETITTEHDLEAAGAAAFRREVFLCVGLFDEAPQRTEDSDMTVRLRKSGISVYYYPHLSVKHQYSQFMLDTVYKCFLTGFNAYKFRRKHRPPVDSVGGGLRGRSAGTLRIHCSPRCGQCASAKSRAQGVLYLPFMLVFRVTSKLGLFCSFVSHRLHVRRTSLLARNREKSGRHLFGR